MVSGKNMPIMPMATAPATQLIRLKFLSLNRPNGTSGSLSCVLAWTNRNTPSSTTPTPITSGIEMNEVIFPQLYF